MRIKSKENQLRNQLKDINGKIYRDLLLQADQSKHMKHPRYRVYHPELKKDELVVEQWRRRHHISDERGGKWENNLGNLIHPVICNKIGFGLGRVGIFISFCFVFVWLGWPNYCKGYVFISF